MQRGGTTIFEHDAIMERLEDIAIDRYLPMDVYKKSLNDWEGIPIIYAQEHPDMTLLINDPEKALEKINGKVIGKITKPRIVEEGQPRVEATYIWNDPEVEELYKKGTIATSTGSFCESVEDPGLPKGIKRLAGKQIPNHLLVFKRDEQNLPKDKGTYILNKEEIILADQIENKGATISKENASELRGILDKLQTLFKRMAGTPEEEEHKESAPDTKKIIEDQKMKEEMEALRKELEEKNKSLTELQARAEDQAKSIEAFKKKEDELKQKEMERSWESVKATLPPGLTHKEESEKELKELYFNKPHEFIAKVSVIKPQKETSPEGEEHAFKENAISAGRTVGYFDMNKKEYVR